MTQFKHNNDVILIPILLGAVPKIKHNNAVILIPIHYIFFINIFFLVNYLNDYFRFVRIDDPCQLLVYTRQLTGLGPIMVSNLPYILIAYATKKICLYKDSLLHFLTPINIQTKLHKIIAHFYRLNYNSCSVIRGFVFLKNFN